MILQRCSQNANRDKITRESIMGKLAKSGEGECG
jgi:hypothetical protein